LATQKPGVSGDVKDFAKNSRSDIIYYTTTPFAKGDVEKVTSKDRLIWSALTGIAGVAAGLGGNRIFKNIPKSAKMIYPPLLGVAGGAAGWHIPDMVNVGRRVKSGDLTSVEGRDLYRKMMGRQAQFSRTGELFEKEASILDKMFTAGGKLIGGTTKAVGKGLAPRWGVKSGQKVPLGRKLWSVATYGGLGGGAIYGGTKAVQALDKSTGPDHTRRSGANYTTLLRNNILAGKINPSELSQRDLVSVRKLGMK